MYKKHNYENIWKRFILNVKITSVQFVENVIPETQLFQSTCLFIKRRKTVSDKTFKIKAQEIYQGQSLISVVCQVCGFRTHTKPKMERHMVRILKKNHNLTLMIFSCRSRTREKEIMHATFVGSSSFIGEKNYSEEF